MAASQDAYGPVRTSAPVLSMATSGPRLVRLGTLVTAARLAGLRWVDLELGRPEQKATTLARTVADGGLDVRALWLPPESPARLWIDRSTRLAHLVGELIAGTGARTVVLDRPHGTARASARQSRLLQAVRANVPPGARLTFAIRPRELVGTRAHLADLAVLRRAAEEWDVDLALDLQGSIDPTWEAEAAVSKVLPRLTVVRVGPVDSLSSDPGRAKETARVLAFLADLGYGRAIAIAPSAPLWRPDRAAYLAHSCRAIADAVLGRYRALRGDLWLDAPAQEADKL